MSEKAQTDNMKTRVRVNRPKRATLIDWNRKSLAALRQPFGWSIGEENRLHRGGSRRAVSMNGELDSPAAVHSETACRFATDFSHVPARTKLQSTNISAVRGPVDEDGEGDREQTTRSAAEASSVTQGANFNQLGLGGQMLFRQGGGGGTPASIIPNGIATTSIDRDTPSLGPTYYGSVFKHTLSTSGGTISADVTIAEKVGVTRDDFNTGFTGVPLGTLTWGAAAGTTAPLSGNDMYDNIGTSNINVTNFVPGPPGLPAIMRTPQELHYRIGTGAWIKFADVPMSVTLREIPGPLLNPYEVETRVNNVSSVQPYTGPT